MNTNPRLKFAAWCIVVALVGASGLTLRGSDKAPDRAPEKAPERTPLKLQTDTKPINRDSSERVSYAPIVKKTAASVVFVYSSKKVPGRDLSPFFDDPMFRRFFGNPDNNGSGNSDGSDNGGGNGNRNRNGNGNGGGSNRGRNRRTPDQTQSGLGSGIVITADGYILTNNHVVDGADDVKVSIGESTKRYDAKVIGRDALADVAVLKIEATGLSPAMFGDSEQLQVGDVVLAIGDPFGLGQSVSRGIVSALGRGPGIEQLEDFIQTDAAINPGNSGGALIDTEGRVVGINTAILSGSGSFNGVGFAIPINLVRSVSEQLVAKGHVDRAYLGVRAQPLEDELSTMLKVTHGALIADVQPDTPAEKAGLKDGDIITKVNQVEIRDERHLTLTITQLAPDTQANIEYVRDGKPATVKVMLVQRPTEGKLAGGKDTDKDEGVLNGVGIGDITPQMRTELKLPARVEGVIITSVEPDSASARAGLKEGDVISDLDRKPIHNADEAVKLSFDIKGPKVLVHLWRDGSSRYLVVDETK